MMSCGTKQSAGETSQQWRKVARVVGVLGFFSVSAVACFPKMAVQAPNLTRPAPPPSHPAATSTEWSAAEARAKTEASKSGATKFDAPLHLVLVPNGTYVLGPAPGATQTVNLDAGNCYTVGMAWSFPKAALATIKYNDGTNPKDVDIGSVLQASSGSLAFCLDKPTTATVTLVATDPGGLPLPGELLEYAVVVGSRKEAPAEAAARRQKQSQDDAAKLEALRVGRAQGRVTLCKECDTEYRRCQVLSGDRCERRYYECSQRDARTDFHHVDGDKPCGDPPR